MLKNIYCPKKKEVIVIDSTKETNRKEKYRHRSGKPFEEEMVTVPKKILKKEKSIIEDGTGYQKFSVGELRKEYKKHTGKNASPRQGKEDLIQKITDAKKV